MSYSNTQFAKADHVLLRSMGLSHLGKNEQASRELGEKGMAPGAAVPAE